MAIVKPFAALRPDPSLAARICELPYDVLSSAEARTAAAGNPLSFFHVSKPEIDLPPEVGIYDARVYAQGQANFTQLIQSGALRRDPSPCYYLYRQVMGRHTQFGLAAVTSCEEYLQGIVRKHELTRPDKEDDRVRHIEALHAQTGPAFLTYRADPDLDQCFAEGAKAAPDIDFTAADRVRHTSWTLREPATVKRIESRFASIPVLYIADGHHRSAAAARVYRQSQGAGRTGLFLSVLFPHNQVQILPYHRVLRDLNGLAPAQMLDRLRSVFTVEPTISPEPRARHQVGLYLSGQWHGLTFRPEVIPGSDPLASLDVSLLQNLVLGPMFGIDNPRTSERIQFVGGIRGAAELSRVVDGGDGACAFALFPTQVEDLFAVAELGGLMPPKSTWFEPKLRDGMYCHMLD